MKKIFSSIIAGLGLPVAHAQELTPCSDGTMADPSIGCVTIPANVVNANTPISEILLKVATLGTTGVIAVATLLLIVGGIRYATAVGEEEKLQKAKRLLFWSTVGLVVSLTARLLLGALANAL
ncbi:hypothetical protein HZA44_01650 [Candidatus Peregrinibacteria bacterium]|nr:hypothetical protein [Candidatus Peregrinibacteria bacterium]